tara:strand:+ start:1733 stop:3268 length:1536 start_codon:yes stop_codon:yes gene_type:complete
MYTDILKTKFLTTFRTGNHTIDMILSAIIFSFVTKITYYRHDLYNYILYILRNYVFRRNNFLNFYAIEHIRESCTGNLIERKIYPTSILSLIHYINNNCTNNKEINSKREITKSGMNVFRSRNNYDYDEIDQDVSSDLVVYSIDQDDFFKIKDNIYCDIETVEPEYDNGSTQEKKSKGYTRHIKYRLFSDTLSINELEYFMNNCVTSYKEYTKNLTRNNQYYFTFKEIDDDLILFDEFKFLSNRSFNNIYFENKKDVIEQLNFFLENKEWYDTHGIPHTLGFLFYGFPGCGKTSTIKAIANKTRRHILEIPLSRVKSYQELLNIFNTCEINQKEIPIDQRIYVFEDFDCLLNIVKSRDSEDKNENNNKVENQKLDQILSHLKTDNDNKYKKSDNNNSDDGLKLSHILNVFDGLLEMPGRIIIITTNHPEKIDKALLRPGRIDRKIEFKKCTSNILKKITSDFFISSLNKRLFTDKENKIFDNKSEYYTPAEFIQLCVKYKDSYQCLINELE